MPGLVRERVDPQIFERRFTKIQGMGASAAILCLLRERLLAVCCVAPACSSALSVEVCAGSRSHLRSLTITLLSTTSCSANLMDNLPRCSALCAPVISAPAAAGEVPRPGRPSQVQAPAAHEETAARGGKSEPGCCLVWSWLSCAGFRVRDHACGCDLLCVSLCHEGLCLALRECCAWLTSASALALSPSSWYQDSLWALLSDQFKPNRNLPRSVPFQQQQQQGGRR